MQFFLTSLALSALAYAAPPFQRPSGYRPDFTNSSLSAAGPAAPPAAVHADFTLAEHRQPSARGLLDTSSSSSDLLSTLTSALGGLDLTTLLSSLDLTDDSLISDLLSALGLTDDCNAQDFLEQCGWSSGDASDMLSVTGCDDNSSILDLLDSLLITVEYTVEELLVSLDLAVDSLNLPGLLSGLSLSGSDPISSLLGALGLTDSCSATSLMEGCGISGDDASYMCGNKWGLGDTATIVELLEVLLLTVDSTVVELLGGLGLSTSGIL